MAFQLWSPAFGDGERIPPRFTVDGLDISPPLRWSAPPPNTSFYALRVYDPDAPAHVWTHWLLFNIPASVSELPEEMLKVAHSRDGLKQGRNDFGQLGYNGPAPPAGPAHRYVFSLLALDGTLKLEAGAGVQALEKALEGRVLGEASLVGLYGRDS